MVRTEGLRTSLEVERNHASTNTIRMNHKQAKLCSEKPYDFFISLFEKRKDSIMIIDQEFCIAKINCCVKIENKSALDNLKINVEKLLIKFHNNYQMLCYSGEQGK